MFCVCVCSSLVTSSFVPADESWCMLEATRASSTLCVLRSDRFLASTLGDSAASFVTWWVTTRCALQPAMWLQLRLLHHRHASYLLRRQLQCLQHLSHKCRDVLHCAPPL